MGELINHIRGNRTLSLVFLVNLLTSFHYYLVIYINSSFLNEYFSEKSLSLLYILGSVISTIAFILAPRILNRVGNLFFLLFFILGEILALGGLIFANNPILIIPFFVFHQIAVFMMVYSLDVFLEIITKDESGTGLLRGSYLTFANITLIISPTIVGFLVGVNSYWKVYLLSLLLLVPAFILSKKNFKNIERQRFDHLYIKETLSDLATYPNILRIVLINFILQFFYAWMIIYTPIYLHEKIGIPWPELGLIFTIMLIPFILFEIPAGIIADRKTGEKEVIATGIVFASLATFFIPFVNSSLFFVWAGILFLTRVGASLIEIGTESYFFKQVRGKDANLISVFRITRPTSFILGPAIASISIFLLGFGKAYFVLSAIVLLSSLFLIKLKDTR